ncbi:MAG: PAS domain S-box protein [Rhodospirillaceae bacterium]|nr:PAS domain S-box protein [Rhodospirillaceae bacterium]
MPNTPQRVSRALTLRYIILLTLIAAFSTGVWLFSNAVTRETEGASTIVNLAGRQRMLLQRIAHQSLQLAVAGNEENLDALNTAIEEMATGHAALAGGEEHPHLFVPASTAEPITAIYFEQPHAVDALVHRLLDAARAVADRAEAGTLTLDDPDLATIAELSSGSLIEGLEAAVTAYEINGEAGLARLRVLEFVAWASTVVLLGLLGAFILAPTVRKVSSTLAEKVVAMENLQKSEARLALAAEAGNIGLWDWDAENRQTWHSTRWLRQLGYTPDEVSFDFDIWRDHLHPEDLERVSEFLQDFLDGETATGSRWTIEYRMRTKSGEYRWFRTFGKAQRHGEGQHRHLAGATIDITEEKIQAARLERTAQSLSRAQATAHLGSWEWYVQEDRIQWSDEMYRIFGVEPDSFEPVYDDLLTRMHPEDREQVAEAVRKAIQSGTAFDTEYRIQRDPGLDGWTYVHAIGEVHRDEAGNPTLFAGTLQNISRRKYLEEQLRHRTEDAEMILNHVPVRIWFKDDTNHILRLNQPAAEFMGVSVDEAEGANFYDLLPASAAKLHAQDLEVIDSGVARIGVVEPSLSADGTQGWIVTNRVPYVDPVTGQRFVFVASHDITAEKQADEQRSAAAERYRVFYNSAPAMLCSIDRDGHLVSVSDQWLEKLGYARDEVIGRKLTAFFVSETDDAYMRDCMQRLAETGECKHVDVRVATKVGEVLDTQISAVAVYSESGGVSGAMAVLTDVTERKVIERRLIHSQKMEAVGQLTGGMAHDFNNLLSVIIGNLELLEMTVESDPRAQRRAKAAMEAAERGAMLTQRLLAFSRRQALETKIVHVNDLLENMSGMLQRTLGETIELTFNPGAGLWPTDTDPGQLETSVLNLAINARDAMSGGGRLFVETSNVHLDANYTRHEVDLEPGDYVLVTVSDTGTGIPEAMLDRVFEPFFTTKEVGKGTGLGLSMVMGFVKQSGGHVKIYSEEGHGTTIDLYLRRAATSVDEKPTVVEGFEDYAGAEGTILLVEDQHNIRELAQEMLEALGYRVLTAENGLVALEILETAPPLDLLLTDIVMPGGISGTELAKRACQQRPGLNVLFMSGFAEGRVLAEGGVGTERDLIRKPFRRAEFARKVRAAMGTEPQDDLAAAAS